MKLFNLVFELLSNHEIKRLSPIILEKLKTKSFLVRQHQKELLGRFRQIRSDNFIVIYDADEYKNGLYIKKYGRRLLEITEYKNNVPNGESSGWYINGQLYWHKNYKNGIPIGKDMGWWSNGQPKWYYIWKDGKLIEDKRWLPNGNIHCHRYWKNEYAFINRFNIDYYIYNYFPSNYKHKFNQPFYIYRS